MPKRSSKKPKKRPSDVNQLAKLIVDISTGETEDVEPEPEDGKNPAAVALGRLGGKKGGIARAKKLSKAEKVRIAKRAAAARWKTRRKQQEE